MCGNSCSDPAPAGAAAAAEVPTATTPPTTYDVKPNSEADPPLVPSIKDDPDIDQLARDVEAAMDFARDEAVFADDEYGEFLSFFCINIHIYIYIYITLSPMQSGQSQTCQKLLC